jgi:hypothetical protein
MDPLLIIIIMLIVFWGGGLAIVGAGYTFIHVLLVLAIVVFIVRLLQNPRGPVI